MYKYEIYGLQLQSDRPLRDLTAGDPHLPTDFVVHWEAAGPQALAWQPVSNSELVRKPRIHLWQASTTSGTYLRLGFDSDAGQARFVFDPTCTQLWVSAPAAVVEGNLEAYLVGPVLGCVLRRRGRICLHASVVALHGQAAVVLGAKKAGKSTTAAALAQQGALILSDDLAVLTTTAGGYLVQPGYANLRLWPAALRALYGDVGSLPLVHSDRPKRALALADGTDPDKSATFIAEPLPVAAIYLLGTRISDGPLPAIEQLGRHESLALLVAHSYVNYVVDGEHRALELQHLAQVVDRLPVRRIKRSNDLASLPNLAQTILCDLAGQIASTTIG